MTTFEKTIGISEHKYGYLNLTSDDKKTHGHNFPPPNSPVMIVTPNKQQYPASMHTMQNQIWGNLKIWFKNENINPTDRIKITYDPSKPKIDGRFPIEITRLTQSSTTPTLSPALIPDEEVERITEINMQMENDLENFLVDNLHLIDKDLKLYQDGQGKTGRQFFTEIGDIDLLCKKKDDFVVIELKKGRSSDKVVGQISRYIGWVKEKLANGNNVKGIIIVHDFDPKLKYAVLANPIIDLKYYQIKIDFVTEQDIIAKNN